MAKARRAKPARRRDKKGGPGSGRRKSCPYCKDKIEQVDYKDVATLRRFVSERGKIRSRRISGACRRHQNQLATRGQARARDRAAALREPTPARSAPSAAGAAAGTASARSASAMPEAILLKDVETLGEKGDRRRRLQGLPAQLPDPAQAGPAGDQGRPRRGRSAAPPPRSAPREEAVGRAAEQAELLNKTVLTISQQAGDDGRLFGSVTTQDIADAIQEARGIAVDRRKIHLDEPIKHVGHLHGRRRDGRRRHRQRQDDGQRAVARANPSGRAEGLLREAFFASARRRAAPAAACDDFAQACEESRRVCGEARGCRPPPLLRSDPTR